MLIHIASTWRRECFSPLQYLKPIPTCAPSPHMLCTFLVQLDQIRPFRTSWFPPIGPFLSSLLSLFSYFFQLTHELKTKHFWEKTLYLLGQFSYFAALMEVKIFSSPFSPALCLPPCFISSLKLWKWETQIMMFTGYQPALLGETGLKFWNVRSVT